MTIQKGVVRSTRGLAFLNSVKFLAMLGDRGFLSAAYAKDV